MWAGSRHRDKRGGTRGKSGGEKNVLGAFGDGSVISTMYRLKGGEGWRRGEAFWRLHCGCSLDVPMTGTRLGDARRRRFGFFICLAPPGFSWPAQARF